MSRRTLIWHLGSAHAPRPVIPANLERHRETLQEAGVRVVASAESARLATHELLRTHEAAGLDRDEVEGCWSRVCDRVWEHKGVSVLSTPDLCLADKDQLRLALDPLIGVEVHLVLTLDSFSQQLYGGWLAELREGRTTGWDTFTARVLDPERGHRQAQRFWAGHDLEAVTGRWGWTLHPARVHVLADRDPANHWRGLLDLLGVPAHGLHPELPPYADPAGVAVLRKVNRLAESALAPAWTDRLSAGDPESAAMPVADTGALAPLVERWAGVLAESGHDVRGDLHALLDEGAPTALPRPRDQLGVAVEALAEALAENTRLREVARHLESDRDRLDRKRRKLKRRLAGLIAGDTAASEPARTPGDEPEREAVLSRE